MHFFHFKPATKEAIREEEEEAPPMPFPMPVVVTHRYPNRSTSCVSLEFTDILRGLYPLRIHCLIGKEELPVINLRRPSDRCSFITGILISVKRWVLANSGPCLCHWNWSNQAIPQWASYQIRKIAGCACAENAGNVFPAVDLKGNR